MPSVQSLRCLCLISAFSRTISASPLPRRSPQAKRGTTPQNIGSGFAIAICVVILAVVFYYLGMRHKRTKSWLKKRKAPAALEAPATESTTDGQRHKRQISCPIAVASSAPIKPCDDPVEAATASLRCYEMPTKEVYEMGLPSPKKPPSRVSWLSLDRKPWWLTNAGKEGGRHSVKTSGSKSMRTWFRSDSIVSVPEDRSMRTWFRSDSVGTMPEHMPTSTPSSPPPVPKVALSDTPRAINDNGERRSDGSTLMDWSGLDYVRKIYVERKSRIGL